MDIDILYESLLYNMHKIDTLIQLLMYIYLVYFLFTRICFCFVDFLLIVVVVVVVVMILRLGTCLNKDQQ